MGLADGVVITRIVPSGPASEANPALEPNDVITSVDGRPVKNPAELRAVVTRKAPGTELTLEVHRADKTFSSKVSPQPMPDDLASNRETRKKAGPPRFLGMVLKPLSEAEAKDQGIDGGAVVMDVPEDGRAAKAGLKDGDIITEINHKGIGSTADFKAAIQEADTEKDVVLVVRRKAKEVILVIKAATEER